MQSLQAVHSWPVEHVSVAVVDADGRMLGSVGPQDRPFRLASVTKLLTAYTALVAVQNELAAWTDPAGPAGSTLAHLASHASGMAPDGDRVLAAPGARRIYSNAAIDLLAGTVAQRASADFADLLDASVLAPLGMRSSELTGPASSGGVSTCADLTRFVAELQAPTLVPPAALERARTVCFPGLNGVLPGFGSQRPNDWGLGMEIRGGKTPHWTGANSSPATFGHFGQSGTFLWVDPVAGVACVALTDRDFGPWAAEVWPVFTDGVLAELS